MVFFKPTVLAVVSIIGVAAFAASNAAETDKNVAIVNGVPIPQARMDFVVKMQQAQGQKDSEEMRKQLREALISREIVTQEAIKKGLDKSVDYQTQMDLAKQQVLVNAYLEDYLKTHEPTEADLKAEYEAVKKEQYDPNAKEYKVRHILIKTPTKPDAKAEAAAKKKAEGLLAQLKKGAKFDELAKKYSDDAGSKVKGGELDWTDGANLVKPFGDAMKAMSKGETTKTLVKTQYGYHILRLDDVRSVDFPAYEQVKDDVAKQLLAKQRDKLIEDLRKAAKVE
ncbi:MAG: peptidylprolyl isomerase [Betaproteobacteria bacterium]